MEYKPRRDFGTEKRKTGDTERKVYLSNILTDLNSGKGPGSPTSFGAFGPANDMIVNDFFGANNENSRNDDLIVLDSDWVKSRFMTPLKNMPGSFTLHALKSSTHFKFRDTSLGGNFACNAPPQACRYADIRADDYLSPYVNDAQALKQGGFKLTDPNTDLEISINPQMTFESVTPYNGMGRYYGESMDDGRQLIYLQFGVPKFAGFLDFLTNSVSYIDSYVANHGRIPKTYQIVEIMTRSLRLIAFPSLSLLAAIAGAAADILLGDKPFNYYFMEPTMHVYWGCVNQIANQFATSMGILVPLSVPNEEDPTLKARNEMVPGVAYAFSKESIQAINRMFAPNAIPFGEFSNYIDVYAMMMRQQNMIDSIIRAKSEDRVAEETKTLNGIHNYLWGLMGLKKESLSARLNRHLYMFNDALSDALTTKEFDGSKNPYIERMDDVLNNKKPSGDEEALKNKGMSGKVAEDVQEKEKRERSRWESLGITTYAKNAISGYLKDWSRVFDSTVRGVGGQAIFEVQHTGSSSDSFSNSYGEIPTGDKIKSLQQGVRQARFNFSGGQTGMDIVDTIKDGLVQVVNGTLDGFFGDFAGVIRGFIAGGYIDIPQAWNDSTTNIASVSYSMDLIAPYGHPWSRFQNIIVPLSMLLAGTLPLRVGKASYTSPFLCSVFSKSVQKIKLGMITDLSITRGSSNLAYTIDKKINAISVSFTISDFSGKITAPINNSIFSKTFAPYQDLNSPFSNYLDLIGGRDYHDDEWMWNRVKRNFSIWAKNHVGIYASTTGGLLNPAAIGEVIWLGPLSSAFSNFYPEHK